MSFDDSTGGIDRRHFHNSHEAIYGNDFGDGKPKRLFDASRTYEERREVDSVKQAEYLARRAKIAADATRSRAAPIEAKIREQRIAQSKTAMGAAMRAALDKRDRRNGKERPEK